MISFKVVVFDTANLSRYCLVTIVDVKIGTEIIEIFKFKNTCKFPVGYYCSYVQDYQVKNNKK